MRVGSEAHVRAYAAGFLFSISMRPDGADLLSSKSDDISSLLVDVEPGIQRIAVAITDSVIAKPQTNTQPYMSGLMAGIQKPQTPQDIAVQMAGPLLVVGSGDTRALKRVLDFYNRADLTAETRKQILNGEDNLTRLPVEEAAQLVSKGLDDPDPRVRVSAVIAFARSKSTLHDLAKDRVDRMAKDPQEHPQVRELAKKALAGETSLDPNIDVKAGKP